MYHRKYIQLVFKHISVVFRHTSCVTNLNNFTEYVQKPVKICKAAKKINQRRLFSINNSEFLQFTGFTSVFKDQIEQFKMVLQSFIGI